MNIWGQMQPMVTAAGESVLTGFLGLTVSAQEEQCMEDKKLLTGQITVIIQLSGDVNGQVICSMDTDTALRIVGQMFGGMIIEQLDDMGWSAVQEFGNWFVSGIATQFAGRGMTVNITHPLLNEGQSVIHAESTFYLTPLLSSCGSIDVYYSIHETASSEHSERLLAGKGAVQA